MSTPRTEKEAWEQYCTSEIAAIKPLIAKHGFTLDEEQPHIKGERYLTRPFAGAKKLLLLGRKSADRARVVIKAASDRTGTTEIQHERICRETLRLMNFAHNILYAPQEILCTKEGERMILVSEFIEQPRSFIERPVAEQFTIALSIFKIQEQVHATTYGHIQIARKTFGEMRANDYLTKCQTYITEVTAATKNEKLRETLNQSLQFLNENKKNIEQYTGFLANWDLTPQNIRVTEERIYFLDQASFHFSNKHESWARFINFMTLHEPRIADVLVGYVRNNRAPEESASLKLMRVYRLIELIRFYAGWLARTEGNVHQLALVRIDFWHQVLKATLDNTFVSERLREQYIKTRDMLRSEDERKRQVGLH
jgi:hypothetical protein